MKKLLALILAITMLLSLAACGSDDSKSAGNNDSNGNNSISNSKDKDTVKKEEKEDPMKAVLLEKYEDVGNDPNNLAYSCNAPAFDEDYIYYAEGNTIYRMDKATATTEYFAAADASGNITYLNIYNGVFYFRIDYEDESDIVASIDMNTQEYKVLYDGEDNYRTSIEDVYVFGNNIVYTTYYTVKNAGLQKFSRGNQKIEYVMITDISTGKTRPVCTFTDHKINIRGVYDDTWDYVSAPEAVYYNYNGERLYIYAKNLELSVEDGGSTTYCDYYCSFSMEEIWGQRGYVPANEDLLASGIMKSASCDTSRLQLMFLPSGIIKIPAYADNQWAYAAYSDIDIEGKAWDKSTLLKGVSIANDELVQAIYCGYHYMIDGKMVSITNKMGFTVEGSEDEGGIYIIDEGHRKIGEIYEIIANINEDISLRSGVHNDTLYIITENADEEDILMTITSDGEVTETVIN